MDIHREEQRLQAAAWVVQAAPGAAYTVEVLLRAPSVPLNIAKQIVSAGTRVMYAPLLAAASSMVAGVEVWVQAQQELGIHTDVPPAAQAICCSSIRDIYTNWVSSYVWRLIILLTPRSLLDLMMQWYMVHDPKHWMKRHQCCVKRPLVMH
jgi:hypothetical protein